MNDNTSPENQPQELPDVPDNNGAAAVAMLFALLIIVLFLLLAGGITPAFMSSQAAAPTQVAAAVTPTIGSIPPILDPQMVAAAHPIYVQAAVNRGRNIYSSICFACHGADARGVPGLGKTLIGSEFIDGLTDEELVQFLIVGRQPNDPLNTSGQLMPARGGNPSLTDEDLAAVVAYIRVLNGAPVEGSEAQLAAAGNATPQPAATARPFEPAPINALDASVVSPSSGEAEGLDLSNLDGEAAFIWACSTCHADRAALAETALSDEAIIALLTNEGLPASETDFVHPYRGGYPELTDEQLAALAAYIRGSS